MPSSGEGNSTQKDRLLSSANCSTSSREFDGCTGIRGFDKGHRRKGALKQMKTSCNQQQPHTPLASILVGHICDSELLKRCNLSKPLGEADWFFKGNKTINNVKHLLCGAFSAIFSKTTTAPLERIKMEMQIHRSNSALAVVEKVVKEGGCLSLWQGNLMNIIRVAPHKAVNFYSFYLYRTTLNRTLAAAQMSLGGTERFVAGALAGSTATMMCYPLDVIRTRMLSGKETYTNARSTIRIMLKEESLASFYVGCFPAVLSTAASGAIFYGVYDILKTRYLTKQQRRQQAKKGLSDDVVMGAGRTMLYGALAGAAAESILYPLEVLRRRMQLQGIGAREILQSARAAERATLAAAGKQSIQQAQKAAAASLRRNYFEKALNAAVDIYKIDGLPGFYNGIAPHILQVLPSAALSYYFYEACKQALQVEERE